MKDLYLLVELLKQRYFVRTVDSNTIQVATNDTRESVMGLILGSYDNALCVIEGNIEHMNIFEIVLRSK